MIVTVFRGIKMDADELPASTYLGVAAGGTKIAELLKEAWGEGDKDTYSFAEIEGGPRTGYVIYASKGIVEGGGLASFYFGINKGTEQAAMWLLNLVSQSHYPDMGRRLRARGWEIRRCEIGLYRVAICWAAYCPQPKSRKKEPIPIYRPQTLRPRSFG